MQINISEKTLQEERDKATSKAVSDAFGDYLIAAASAIRQLHADDDGEPSDEE